MNFLTHIFLAGTDSEMITGALMGDFLRGLDRSTLPSTVQDGITHHLGVDSFTDSHDVIRNLKPLFSKERRRFSGIILDVTFDHFLHRHWKQFANESISHCIERAHRSLLIHKKVMPPRMSHVVKLMIQHEVLHSYSSIEGVGVALDRIADRFSRPTPLYRAVEEIRLVETEIEEGFLQFFPELFEQFYIETAR